MKLHYTLVEKLISVYQQYGGHREEKKLREELQKLNISVYQQQSSKEVAVLTEDLKKHTRK